MSTDTIITEVAIEHPMEEIFGIESGTTMVPRTEKTTVLATSNEYDDKDVEIEDQFQEIYDSALSAFEDMSAEVEVIEGKYKARLMEVANQSLNTALAAAKEKSHTKQHKDKLSVTKGKVSGNTTNNTLIVADRNEILKAMGRETD